MHAAQAVIDTVVFDLGGVLVDWNPRHLYRELIPDEELRERFLAEICPQSWNERQDAGRSVAEATAERIALFPQHADLIAAYYGRWEEMLAGAIEDTVVLLEELAGRGVPLYALTNWSAELFPVAWRRFGFLRHFRGIVVSGEERLIKPDAAIFRRLCDQHGLTPQSCLFIDDNPANVEAAAALGFATHRFTEASALRARLTELGFV
jgi:2-haloacid dehalogenase